jgi:hypothetical protein
MKKPLDSEMSAALLELAKAVAKRAESESPEAQHAIPVVQLGIHILQPIICDYCEDEEKEAFKYCATDASSKYWEGLCNDCFDLLGCKHEDLDDEDDELFLSEFNSFCSCRKGDPHCGKENCKGYES